MPEMLTRDTHMTIYLGYGWFSPDNSDVAPDVYEKNALGIACEVCLCLQEEGIDTKWDGSFARKIGVTLNWQRRKLLE